MHLKVGPQVHVGAHVSVVDESGALGAGQREAVDDLTGPVGMGVVPLLLGDGEVPLLLGDRGAVAGLRGVAAVHLEVSGGDLRAMEAVHLWVLQGTWAGLMVAPQDHPLEGSLQPDDLHADLVSRNLGA